MKNDVTQKFFELIWPFPSTAERIVRVMAKSGHKAVTSEFVERTAGLGVHEMVRIPQILRAMATVKIVNEVRTGLWISSLEEQEMNKSSSLHTVRSSKFSAGYTRIKMISRGRPDST